MGYVNEGLTLYFLCGRDGQKAANLARDDGVSLTIDHDTGYLDLSLSNEQDQRMQRHQR